MLLLPDNAIIQSDWQGKGIDDDTMTFGSFWHALAKHLN